MTVLIELRDVRKSFGPVDVLKGVNLKIHAGMVSALVDQSNPVKLLQKYPKIASVAKHNIETDIPRKDLPAWVTLVERMQGGKITSLPFTSSVVNTSHPDFDRIHALVKKALRASKAGGDASTVTATGTATGSTGTATTPSSGSKSPSQNVDDVC